MKLNKAEKFVNSQFKLGKTFNGIRLAIFKKLLTWNFPPEYKDALISMFPTLAYEIKGYDPLDDCLNEIGHSAEAEEAVFGKFDNIHEPCTCPFCGEEACVCDIIDVGSLPHPETQEWEEMIDGMRDMEKYSGVIKAARESIEARGLDFNEEFEKWKKKEKKDHV